MDEDQEEAPPSALQSKTPEEIHNCLTQESLDNTNISKLTAKASRHQKNKAEKGKIKILRPILEVPEDSEKDPRVASVDVERNVPDIKVTINCHKHVFKRIHDDIKYMTIKHQGSKRPFLISDKKLMAMVNIISNFHKD